MHLYIQKKTEMKILRLRPQVLKAYFLWFDRSTWKLSGDKWGVPEPWTHTFPDLKKWFSLLSHFRVITMVIIRTHKQITSKVTNRVPGCPKTHVEAVVPSVLTWYKGHAWLCATDCSAWWRHQAAEAKAFCSLEGHFCTRNRNVTFLKFHPPTKKTHGH